MDPAVTRFLTEPSPGREEAPVDTGTRVLADCFDLLRLLGLCRKDAMVLLLDEGFQVLGAHSDHPHPDGIVGKGFDPLYKQGITPHRITKFIKGPGEGVKCYIYFYHEPGEAGIPAYYLCSVAEREEDDVLGVYLANAARSIRYIARVVNRHAGLGGDRQEGLPSRPPVRSGFISQKEQMAVNRKAILETLRLTGGNKRKAAHILGISRQTIYRLLRE